MIDINAIKEASPIEIILSSGIRSNALNVIIDDTYSLDKIPSFISSLNSFSHSSETLYKVVVLGDSVNKSSFEDAFSLYAVKDKFTFVCENEKDEILSYFLCSNVLFTRESSSSWVKLAKDLYLPVILTDKNNKSVYFDEATGIFHIDESDAGLSAAALIIHEKKYRSVLSGFPKLVKEDC